MDLSQDYTLSASGIAKYTAASRFYQFTTTMDNLLRMRLSLSEEMVRMV